MPETMQRQESLTRTCTTAKHTFPIPWPLPFHTNPVPSKSFNKCHHQPLGYLYRHGTSQAHHSSSVTRRCIVPLPRTRRFLEPPLLRTPIQHQARRRDMLPKLGPMETADWTVCTKLFTIPPWSLSNWKASPYGEPHPAVSVKKRCEQRPPRRSHAFSVTERQVDRLNTAH